VTALSAGKDRRLLATWALARRIRTDEAYSSAVAGTGWTVRGEGGTRHFLFCTPGAHPASRVLVRE